MQKGKFTSKYSTYIMDPTFDNSFKTMLGTNKSILKSLLNSVLFPKSKSIYKLEYCQTNYPGKIQINRRYGFGAKSIDIGCKCYLKEDSQLKIKNNRLIIDLEMQIGFSEQIEENFIDYSNIIRVESSFENIWVVSFILKKMGSVGRNNTSSIELLKFKSGKAVSVRNYEYLKILEIDLNYCNSLIENGKNIAINNDEILKEAGKEWLRLLDTPNWCKEDSFHRDVYIFPRFDKKKFFSCSCVRNAMKNIIFNYQDYNLSYVKEKHEREEKKFI